MDTIGSVKGPVLVVGGTGFYGRRIVEGLRRRGVGIRVLSRRPEKACWVLGEGVEVVPGDLVNRSDVVRALQGVSAVVVAVSAFSRRLIRRLWEIEHDGVLGLFEAAETAGVRRLVYVSTYDLRLDLIQRYDIEIGRVKMAVEAALAGSGLDWTVLGCPPCHEIFFAMIRGRSTMVVPGGGPPAFPTISCRDVGPIGAEAALRTDLGGLRLRMTGPEALGFPEAAARIGAVWGRTIKFRKVPLAVPMAAAVLSRPFVPFVYQLVGTLRMLNDFPQDLVAQVPEDHARLQELFDYTPRSLEDDARDRLGS